MKILLDECIDRRFGRDLTGHDVWTVPQMGWTGVKNGSLMTLAADEFEIFITVDRNLSYQQNIPKFNLAVIVLSSISNRYADLIPFAPLILECIPTLVIGNVTQLSLDGLRP